jgi:hypothetical protein
MVSLRRCCAISRSVVSRSKSVRSSSWPGRRRAVAGADAGDRARHAPREGLRGRQRHVGRGVPRSRERGQLDRARRLAEHEVQFGAGLCFSDQAHDADQALCPVPRERVPQPARDGTDSVAPAHQVHEVDRTPCQEGSQAAELDAERFRDRVCARWSPSCPGPGNETVRESAFRPVGPPRLSPRTRPPASPPGLSRGRPGGRPCRRSRTLPDDRPR